jgi:hypothetical protein
MSETPTPLKQDRAPNLNKSQMKRAAVLQRIAMHLKCT